MNAPLRSATPLPIAPVPNDPTALHRRHVELRRVANELESVFVAQLLRAMRESVPESGLIDSTPGQDLFTEMLDDRLAGLAAQHLPRGVGEALYRQLARGLPPDPGAAPAALEIQRPPAPAAGALEEPR